MLDRFLAPRRRRIPLVLAIVMATFGVGAVSSLAGAATDVVTNCSANPAVTGSLPYEVANAASGDTITFASPIASLNCPLDANGIPVITLSSGQISVPTSLTVDGPGPTALAVSGNDAGGVFLIGSGTSSTIEGLTIEDSGTATAGAINNFGTLVLSTSTLSHNSATYGGGAINNYGTLTVQNSTIANNSAAYGGGISNEGSATITASTVSNNTASDGGGGIANSGTPSALASLTVTGSSVSGNGGDFGAGIDNGYGTVHLSGDTVSNNTTISEGAGGGIYNGSNVNGLSALTITGSTLSGNGAPGGVGGAIDNDLGTASVGYSLLSGNTAYSGGGVANSGTATVTSSSLVADNATQYGGGLDNSAGGSFSAAGTTVSGNGAGYEGGGIYNAGTTTLTTTIVANSTSGLDCSGPIVSTGYNLDDDGSCGFGGTSLSDVPSGLSSSGLQNNGGPTQTIALVPGSSAVGAVPSSALCAGTDQRGAARPVPCDIGAYDSAGLAQVITFTSTAPTSAIVGGPTYPVTATGGASGNAIGLAIASSSASICSLSGSVVSFAGAGTCAIDASQAGNTNYAKAATKVQSFTVGPGNQTITFTSTIPTNATVNGSPYVVTANGGPSGNPVTFASLSLQVCTASASTVSMIGAGNCVVQASQAGNANYGAASSIQQSFGVAPASQAITFTSQPVDPSFGTTYAVSASGGASGNPVTFGSGAPSVCSVTGSSVSFVGVGSCTIDANQAGNTNYLTAPQVPQTFGVTVGAQAISFSTTAPTGAVVGGPTYVAAATGGASGNPVGLSVSSPPSICTLSASTVTMVGVGTCSIDANQAGNADYASATQAVQSFHISPASQTITFTSTAPTDATPDGPIYPLTATGGGSGNPVSFSSATTSVCVISDSTVSFIRSGTCVVEANEAGTANYAAAPTALQAITVAAGSPAITSGASTTGVSGATLSFTVTTNGTSVKSIKVGGRMPQGVTFVDNHNGTATLSGTPKSGPKTGATYSLTIKVTFWTGTKSTTLVTQPFSLVIEQEPAITSKSSSTASSRSRFSFAVKTTGDPMATISETGVLPTGIVLTDNGNGTATLAGTPGAGTAGAYHFSITASNEIGSPARQDFTLSVKT